MTIRLLNHGSEFDRGTALAVFVNTGLYLGLAVLTWPLFFFVTADRGDLKSLPFALTYSGLHIGWLQLLWLGPALGVNQVRGKVIFNRGLLCVGADTAIFSAVWLLGIQIKDDLEWYPTYGHFGLVFFISALIVLAAHSILSPLFSAGATRAVRTGP